MSMDKWRQLAKRSGEEFFKLITKRLDKSTKEPEPIEEPAVERDYGMEDFRPDSETPPPTPAATPPVTSTPPPSSPASQVEEEEEAGVPLPKRGESQWRQAF